MKKGMVFEFDLMLSFIVTCAIIYLMFLSLNQLIEERVSFMKESELKQKAVLLADSILKNSSKESPWVSASYFNSELKRVEANVLNETLLNEVNEALVPSEVKKIYLKKKKRFFLNRKLGKECVGIERLVLVKNLTGTKKDLLGVVVCGEQ
jgi:biopolymer transport protein ExbB/TolQ